jgi:hypothetical protein
MMNLPHLANIIRLVSQPSPSLTFLYLIAAYIDVVPKYLSVQGST